MPYGSLPDVPDFSPSRRFSPNFSDGRNFNVSDQGHGMGPSPGSGFVPIFSVQSAHPSYPLGFVRRQSPGQMTLAWPSSRGSAGAWDPWAGSESYPHHSANESPSPYIPVVLRQNWRRTSTDLRTQDFAVVENYWGGPFSQVTTMLPKRKALVIGNNYSDHPVRGFRLRYCTEDAWAMASYLCTNLGFAPNNVYVMTDSAENPRDRPSKPNILRAMRELVRNPQPYDSFFLYFSGHGVQIKDTDGDESDGLDECICAMDYYGDDPYPTANTPGLIVDDVIHDILVRPLPRHCRLTALFDSCHSGTALDLPYVYDSNGVVKRFRHPDILSVLRQKASYADVTSLGASKDNQSAHETERGGALRRAFIDTMNMFDNNLSYKELIQNVLEYMKEYKILQRPQLSTSYEKDTNLPFIV